MTEYPTDLWQFVLQSHLVTSHFCTKRDIQKRQWKYNKNSPNTWKKLRVLGLFYC